MMSLRGHRSSRAWNTRSWEQVYVVRQKNRPDEVYDKQARGFNWRKGCELLEGGNGDAGDTKDNETGESDKVSWG